LKTYKELETDKEELITLNTQLQDKIAELTAAHADLAKLLSCTAIATLFLDTQLRVNQFTPAA